MKQRYQIGGREKAGRQSLYSLDFFTVMWHLTKRYSDGHDVQHMPLRDRNSLWVIPTPLKSFSWT